MSEFAGPGFLMLFESFRLVIAAMLLAALFGSLLVALYIVQSWWYWRRRGMSKTRRKR